MNKYEQVWIRVYSSYIAGRSARNSGCGTDMRAEAKQEADAALDAFREKEKSHDFQIKN